jgi:alpha-L-rhamnosidase
MTFPYLLLGCGVLLMTVSTLTATPSTLDASAPGLQASDLRCEYLINPLGIDATAPRLNWKMTAAGRGKMQTAYRILIASSPENLDKERGDLWDSGKVTSDQSIQIVYGGKPLPSRQPCFWKVRIWDNQGQESDWSKPASWTMGLLKPEDWTAKWIGAPKLENGVSPLLRKSFPVAPNLVRATAYVSGLGFYELRLNGKKVGDHELDPGFTRYDRRVLYVTYDVTKQMRKGKNALGAMLGNGWYNYTVKAAWDFDKAAWRDRPKLICQVVLEYADGTTQTVVTDDSWKTAASPLLSNDLLTGESYDAGKEMPGWDTADFNDAAWTQAETVAAPQGVLSAQVHPPIRVTKTIKPVKVTEPKPGVYVYNLGQNIAGIAEITVDAPAGTVVEMRYGEALNADGTLNQEKIAVHTRQPGFQTDRYTVRAGGKQTWRPRFTYHGFQYIEVKGLPKAPRREDLKGLVLHTDFESAGSFESSNDLLNKIQRNTLWSYVSNFHHIPTDCPQREKNGWTGDAHLAAETGLFNFDTTAAYAKWLQDIQDEQKPDGVVPGIVPTAGWGYAWGNGPAWDSAYPLIAWRLYEFSGDRRILERHYENLKRYVDYLTRRAENGIVSIGLGDWCPAKSQTPVPITSTAYYYVDARILAKMAKVLGKSEDRQKYDALADTIRTAFNQKFYHPETGKVGEGTQTALACALYQGMADTDQSSKVLNNLVAAVAARDGHLDTGILGAKYLLHALADNGRADVAYSVATKTTFPSWGHWIERGATTLWEQWDEGTGGDLSRNHIMFGDISAWFYQTLAGIRPDPDGPGFKKFVVRPSLQNDLGWVKAKYASAHGPIAVEWQRKDDKFTLDVTVPANTTATISIPSVENGAITESGNTADTAEGVRLLRREPHSVVYTVGSGRYSFGSRVTAVPTKSAR